MLLLMLESQIVNIVFYLISVEKVDTYKMFLIVHLNIDCNKKYHRNSLSAPLGGVTIRSNNKRVRQ